MPCCGECNGRLGKIEKELFVRLALCVDPAKAEASGLSAKAIKSLGVGAAGITWKERMHRRFLKLKVIKSMRLHVPGTETFPGLGPHSGYPANQQIEIGVPADMLREVAKKIVRGSEFVLGGRIVEDSESLEIYFVHAHNVPDQVTAAFNGPSADTTHLGPGFIVTRAAAHDRPNAVMYKIIMWGTIVIYASILPQEETSPGTSSQCPGARPTERPSAHPIGDLII